jgi:hypothetical protein
MSPSVWWNGGEFAEILKVNYKTTKILPKSIVMTLGSQEGLAWMLFGNLSATKLDTYAQEVAESFADIGMGSGAISSSQKHPDGTFHLSLQTNLVYVLYEGGMHNILNQVDLFSYAVPLAYSYEYPSRNKSKAQRNSLMTVRYPPDLSNENNDSDNDTAIVIGLSVALGLISIVCIGLIIYIALLKNSLRKTPNSSANSDLL